MSLRFRHDRFFLLHTVTTFLLLFPGFLRDAHAQAPPDQDTIAAGERLVELLDCNVCHTPKILTVEGPKPDLTRLLSGHPANDKLPPPPAGTVGPSAWGGVFSQDMTAWVGPWGTTFGTNLTPDPDTGIGDWTESDFADAIRSGARPPMPAYARLTDEEVHEIFSYLRSIDPVVNEVPAALPPAVREDDR